MSFDYKGKKVLITGSSRGIGRRTAECFAKFGAEVILHYGSSSEEAQDTLRALAGGPHHIVRADLGNPEEVKSLAEGAINLAGRIDILVNNAGIYEESPLSGSTEEEWIRNWDRTISINLIAVAHLSYFIANHMIEQKGGRIINISSRGAFRGEPNAMAYAASKAGLNALSQSMAKSLAPQGVYVYGVAPGFVETDMSSFALKGPEGDAIRNQSPMGRVATTDDVAHAVLMLASEGGEFMTGTIVDVNGASHLRM